MCVAYDIVNVREQSGTGALSVPESIELRAVPLYELYGNSDLYGAFYYIISISITAGVSQDKLRYGNFTCHIIMCVVDVVVSCCTGPMLNAIPQLLSRYNLNCVDSGTFTQALASIHALS